MKTEEKHTIFKPDFLLIPYQLINDRELEPTDRLLYGLIYWFEHMKDGYCKASNNTLASLLFSTTRAVQNSLNKLESRGYIAREYKDEAKRNRSAIRSTIAFKKMNERTDGDRKKTNEPLVTRERTVGDRRERTVGDQSKNTNIKNRNKSLALPSMKQRYAKNGTPGEIAKAFFAGEREVCVPIAQKLSDAGLEKETVIRELKKFHDYWTEPTRSGKKTRWELEPTFDVPRRLGTWFRNMQSRSGNKRAGGGVAL